MGWDSCLNTKKEGNREIVKSLPDCCLWIKCVSTRSSLRLPYSLAAVLRELSLLPSSTISSLPFLFSHSQPPSIFPVIYLVRHPSRARCALLDLPPLHLSVIAGDGPSCTIHYLPPCGAGG